jgi:SAM-dependent methyltransferase
MSEIKLDPTLYVKCNGMHREVAENWLKERAGIFEWNHDGTDSLLDVGSGTGDITSDFILPIMPKNSKFLIGADISKDMIDYARQKYENDLLRFVEMDILEGFSEQSSLKNEKFNYVTSFFTLNLVENQKLVLVDQKNHNLIYFLFLFFRLALQNIYNFLKPNGATLITITLDFTIYKVLYDPRIIGKYGDYMKDLEAWDFRKFVEKPVEKFESFLKEIGFRNYSCEVQEVVTFYTKDSMIGIVHFIPKFLYLNTQHFLLAWFKIFPFVNRMTDEVKDQFLRDCLLVLGDFKIGAVDQKTGETGYQNPSKIMLIEAFK